MQNGNAVDWFVDRHIRDGNGERVAFRDPWQSLIYAELGRDTARFSDSLAKIGVKREQRVVLLLQDTADFPIAFWGTMRAGAVPVPINTLLTSDTVAYILGDCRAACVVISAELMPAFGTTIQAAGIHALIVSQPDGSTPADKGCTSLADFLASGDPATPTASASPDEVAFWLYSSGSTGAPKGVRHIHSSLRFTAETYGAQFWASSRMTLCSRRPRRSTPTGWATA